MVFINPVRYVSSDLHYNSKQKTSTPPLTTYVNMYQHVSWNSRESVYNMFSVPIPHQGRQNRLTPTFVPNIILWNLTGLYLVAWFRKTCVLWLAICEHLMLRFRLIVYNKPRICSEFNTLTNRLFSVRNTVVCRRICHEKFRIVEIRKQLSTTDSAGFVSVNQTWDSAFLLHFYWTRVGKPTDLQEVSIRVMIPQ